MAYYSSKSYWDRRYSLNQHPYEWYVGYDDVKEVVEKYMRQGCRVLFAGCGNSLMAEAMYDNSYTDLTCVDFSETIVEYMAKRKGGREGLHYVCHDLRDLPIPDRTFDCIIDKATLDSVLCGQETHTTHRSTQRLLTEISRVLKDNGTFLCISHSPKEERRLLFAPDLKWTVDVERIPKQEGVGILAEEYEHGDEHPDYFVYVCKKGKR